VDVRCQLRGKRREMQVGAILNNNRPGFLSHLFSKYLSPYNSVSFVMNQQDCPQVDEELRLPIWKGQFESLVHPLRCASACVPLLDTELG